MERARFVYQKILRSSSSAGLAEAFTDVMVPSLINYKLVEITLNNALRINIQAFQVQLLLEIPNN
eukprot:snap_masked-scaffold_37-processed-gene-2.74-mRNA-1 protein AED:1.00 eAED:1.00 QI:0/0/0/0/1/1/3/0/64